MKKRAKWLSGALLCAGLWASGCTGDSNVVGGQAQAPPLDDGQFRLTDQLPPGTHNLELVFLNAAGEVVGGPYESANNVGELDLGPIPEGATAVRVDYLRFGGFPMFRAELPLQPGVSDYDDPQEVAVAPHTTTFTVVPVGDGFQLNRQVGGAPLLTENTQNKQRVTESPFRIKAVCYAPAPIGYNSQDGPSIGDLFWDTFQPVQNVNVYNWFALWGNGHLYNDFYGRNDLEKIRDLGANSIRVYCMISRQLPGNKDDPFPAPLSGQHFTHKQFLDSCWNGGHENGRPLKVLVGIPVPPTVLYKYIENPDHTAFWEATLQETVNDLKDHPAVLGFTIWNELDENRSAFPSGGANADSDFYYGRIKKYSDMDKKAAPGKLVGWAAHDFPDLVKFASTQPPSNPYFAQLTSVDFYGVNVYQTVNFDSELGTNAGSYGSLTGAMKKPVIFTEMGFPATGHKDPNNPDSLYEDEDTRKKTAEAVERMGKIAYNSSLLLGLCYFEYCDEWWKLRDQFAWNGTTAAPVVFPNKYWDDESFGLYSVAKGKGKKPKDPIYANNGPVLPADEHTERTEITKALKNVFSSVK